MEYNLPHEKIEVFKPLHGRVIEQMPFLLAEGRVPVWGSKFMKRRIEHSDVLPDLKNYLFLGDLFAYDDKRRSTDLKLILTADNQGKLTEIGRKALTLINQKTGLTNDYAAPLNEQYDALTGNGVIPLTRSELGKLGEDLSEDEILLSRAWRIIARHPAEVPAEFAEDKNLLRDYAQWVASQTKNNKNIGVYLDSNSDAAKLRAAVVDWLVGWSRLSGWNGLDVGGGRLGGDLAP